MKYLLSLFMLLLTLSANAQYRQVRLSNASESRQPKYRDYLREDQGFWCAAEFEAGSSVMVHSPNMQYTGLQFTGGYRLSEYLRLGAGLGVRYYVHNAGIRDTDNKYGVPIYANARGNFVSAYDRDGVPFWSMNIGGITNEGFFMSPTLGYSFGGMRNNFQVGICYTLTAFRNNEKRDQAYSYFGLKLGYEF